MAKYSEWIQFEPVEGVVKIHDGEDADKAAHHVETYVVSKHMDDALRGIIIPNLRLDTDQETKGLLVVGNYGTGKTHLMSVISALCEHKDLKFRSTPSEDLDHEIEHIRGEYKVIRGIIGSTLMQFRDIVCKRIVEGLDKLGVTFEFPHYDKVDDHVPVFEQMMEAFHKKYPKQGLLLVLDELLDFLRQLDAQALIRATSFLRELGEICDRTRFRYIAGLQESLFDNPAFSTDPDITNNLIRINDRFHQVEIIREDIRYVVAGRMLQKTEEAKAQIQAHLEGFFPLFPGLEQDIEEYVELWPVHPFFLKIFHKIHVGTEKRRIFETISKFMRDHHEEEVPSGHPGLLTYDRYWIELAGNPALRTNQDVRAVADCVSSIEDAVDRNLGAQDQWQKEASFSLVYALAVHRLTTPTINSKVGLTSESLRDEIFPHIKDLPLPDATMLATAVADVLDGVKKATRGQLLSYDDPKKGGSGQYYIDLELTEDWNHKVRERAGQLSDEELDKYYFEVLRKTVLGNPDRESDVPNHQIFKHEVPWTDRNANRPGWLFFGAPNERPTAKPPKDFYLYFLQPYKPPTFTDDKKEDELFFKFRGGKNEEFLELIKTYAAARILSTRYHHGRLTLQDIANDAFKELVQWMDLHFLDECRVSWQGNEKKLKNWLGEQEGRVEELIERVASNCLNAWFMQKYPRHPTFDNKFRATDDNREAMAKAAIKYIATGQSTEMGASVLESLEMLDGNDFAFDQSSYAGAVLKIIQDKGKDKVTNFADIFDYVNERHFSKPDLLDPEWIVLVLAALSSKGHIRVVFGQPSEKVDYDNLIKFTQRSGEKFWKFKHLERPKGLPLAAMRELCGLLDIPEGLVSDTDERSLKNATQQILVKSKQFTDRCLQAEEFLRRNPALWGVSIVAEETVDARCSLLAALKEFLDGLQVFDQPAKWRNFSTPAAEIAQLRKANLGGLRDAEARVEGYGKLSEAVTLLANGWNALADNHSWKTKNKALKVELINMLQEDQFPLSAVQKYLRKVESSLKEYRKTYLSLHRQFRLDASSAERKAKLLNDLRLYQLKQLAKVGIFNEGRLVSLQNDLIGLTECFGLTEKKMEKESVCPDCHFQPRAPQPSHPIGPQDLDGVDADLDSMIEDWTKNLLANLEDPTIQLDLLSPEEREPVTRFMESKDLPEERDELSQLVKSLMQLFEGLIRIEIDIDEIKSALIRTGGAQTPQDVEDRFSSLMSSKLKGKDKDKVRIIIKDASLEELKNPDE